MGTSRGTALGTSRARPSQSQYYDNSNNNGLGSYRSSIPTQPQFVYRTVVGEEA